MIDSIGFKLPVGAGIPIENQAGGRQDRLPASHCDYWHNFRITIKGADIWVRGSLGKYFNGENVTNMTRQMVQAAIEQLEHETGWNLAKASLHSVEVGACFPMKQPVSYYLQSMESKPRHNKIIYSNQSGKIETVLFSQDERSIQFYDKNAETVSAGACYSPNMLRIKDLCSRAVYEIFIEQWGREYFEVQKKRIPVLPEQELTPRGFEKVLAAYAVNNLGIEAVQAMVLEEKYTKMTRHRFRELFTELSRENQITETSSLIDELNHRVQQVLHAKR
jgi:hypothetical protein